MPAQMEATGGEVMQSSSCASASGGTGPSFSSVLAAPDIRLSSCGCAKASLARCMAA